MRNILILASFLFVGAMGCGGGNKNKGTSTASASGAETGTDTGSGSGEASGTGEASGSETAVVGPPDVKWDDMDKDQHKAFMKAKVLPTMKPLFQAFDPKGFADFDCGTCHGDGAKDGTFDMPNPKLPVLPDDQAGFMKVVKDHPQVADFMMKQVKPQMAELLGEPEMDQDHPDGFSCHSCHPSK